MAKWFLLCTRSILLLLATTASIVVAQDRASKAEIKNVDFNNFTYKPECNDRKIVTVQDGFFETPHRQNQSLEDHLANYIHFRIESLLYEDLTGDGGDEAVVIVVCNTGGSALLYEGLIYGMQNERPILLARIEGGDRADGGIVEVVVRGRSLMVARARSVGGACSQDLIIESSEYRLDDHGLDKIGKTKRRQATAQERTKFCFSIDPTKSLDEQLEQRKFR